MKRFLGQGVQRQTNMVKISGILAFLCGLSAVFLVDDMILKEWLIIATTVLTLVSMAIGITITATMRQTLAELTDTAIQLAEGNLTVVIDEPKDDRFDKLVGAFEEMRDQLKESYGAIREYVDELQRRVKELTLLNDIDEWILAGNNLEKILDLVSERICKLVDGDFSLIALTDKKSDHMKIKSAHGFTAEERRRLLIRLKDKIINCDLCLSLISDTAVAVENLNLSQLSDEAKNVCSCFGAQAMLAAPLIIDGKPIGSIVIWYKDTRRFDEAIVGRFKLFVDQTAVAIKSASLVDSMRGLTVEIMRALVMAIDARDSYTANHSDRVSRFAVALSQELGLDVDDVQAIEYAGLLHDIGKIGIDERILNKPSALTIDEMTVMKNHSIVSAEIIRPIEFLADAVPIVRHHHEWFNGKGYPLGLAGEEIPLGARILAVADALEAITSDRTYSEALTLHEGLKRLKAGKGSQFDPEVVVAMSRVIERITSVEDSENLDFDGDTAIDGVNIEDDTGFKSGYAV